MEVSCNSSFHKRWQGSEQERGRRPDRAPETVTEEKADGKRGRGCAAEWRTQMLRASLPHGGPPAELRDTVPRVSSPRSPSRAPATAGTEPRLHHPLSPESSSHSQAAACHCAVH